MDQAPARLRTKPSWLINKIAVQAHRLRAEGLAPGHEFGILAALAEFGPASQISIGQRCGVDRSDTHAAVNDLVDQGFVERAPDPEDRRRNVITITPAGQDRLGALDLVFDQVQDALVGALPAAERAQLVALLTRVYDSNLPPT